MKKKIRCPIAYILVLQISSGWKLLSGRVHVEVTEVCNLTLTVLTIKLFIKFYLPANNRGLFYSHLKSEIRSVSSQAVSLLLENPW